MVGEKETLNSPILYQMEISNLKTFLGEGTNLVDEA
jgi:hypothetical protein